MLIFTLPHLRLCTFSLNHMRLKKKRMSSSILKLDISILKFRRTIPENSKLYETMSKLNLNKRKPNSGHDKYS